MADPLNKCFLLSGGSSAHGTLSPMTGGSTAKQRSLNLQPQKLPVLLRHAFHILLYKYKRGAPDEHIWTQLQLRSLSLSFTPPPPVFTVRRPTTALWAPRKQWLVITSVRQGSADDLGPTLLSKWRFKAFHRDNNEKRKKKKTWFKTLLYFPQYIKSKI